MLVDLYPRTIGIDDHIRPGEGLVVYWFRSCDLDGTWQPACGGSQYSLGMADDFDPLMGGDTRQVGWHADPFGRHARRWWNGLAWSEKIRTDNGSHGIDPPGIDRAPVAVTESVPAEPIEDALLPIKRRPIADKIALFLGCVVFLALIAVFVVALTA